MDIFSYVVAGLESKEFGDEKFYFDKHGSVVAIEHGKKYLLCSVRQNGRLYIPYNRDRRGIFYKSSY